MERRSFRDSSYPSIIVQPELKNVQTFNNFDPLELLLMDESFAKCNDRSSEFFRISYPAISPIWKFKIPAEGLLQL